MEDLGGRSEPYPERVRCPRRLGQGELDERRTERSAQTRGRAGPAGQTHREATVVGFIRTGRGAGCRSRDREREEGEEEPPRGPSPPSAGPAKSPTQSRA